MLPEANAAPSASSQADAVAVASLSTADVPAVLPNSRSWVTVTEAPGNGNAVRCPSGSKPVHLGEDTAADLSPSLPSLPAAPLPVAQSMRRIAVALSRRWDHHLASSKRWTANIPTRSFPRTRESSFFKHQRPRGDSWIPACAGTSGGWYVRVPGAQAEGNHPPHSESLLPGRKATEPRRTHDAPPCSDRDHLSRLEQLANRIGRPHRQPRLLGGAERRRLARRARRRRRHPPGSGRRRPASA